MNDKFGKSVVVERTLAKGVEVTLSRVTEQLVKWGNIIDESGATKVTLTRCKNGDWEWHVTRTEERS